MRGGGGPADARVPRVLSRGPALTLPPSARVLSAADLISCQKGDYRRGSRSSPVATHKSLRPVSILAAFRQYGQQIVTGFNRSADGRSSRPSSIARSHAGQLVAIVSSDVPGSPVGLAGAAVPVGGGEVGRRVGSVGRDAMAVLGSKSCSQCGTAQTGACRTPFGQAA